LGLFYAFPGIDLGIGVDDYAYVEMSQVVGPSFESIGNGTRQGWGYGGQTPCDALDQRDDGSVSCYGEDAVVIHQGLSSDQ
jgi:hypothetical protein